MAEVNRNSGLIANAVATPPTMNQASTGASAYRKTTAGRVTPAADDSANSIHRFVRVPSNCRVESIKVTAAQASTAGAVNVGVYYPAHINAGAVIDADFFASAQSLSAAALSRTEVAFESTTYTLTKRLQPLWQALGLSADPGCELDIAWTISTTFNGGPTEALMEVDFVS